MNKMKKLYVIWGILAVLIFAFLTAFGFMYKKKTYIYKDLENRLVAAEKKYVDSRFLYPENGEVVKITANDLIENEFFDSMQLNDEVCEGYTTVRKDGGVFEYKAYIKCKWYKTKGYQKG